MDSLSSQDCKDLTEAVSNAAPKVRLWYALPHAWNFAINKKNIAEQTEAISDYEKLHEEHSFMRERKSNSRTVHTTYSSRITPGLVLGLRDIEICVYNPQNPLPTIGTTMGLARLVQIDGINWGNIYKAQVNLERKRAFLKEEDQDIAHKLGLTYTPAHMTKTTPLSPSSFGLHDDKPATDEEGTTLLYCDNTACKQRTRSPTLVLDRLTGGLYHSETCFADDMRLKEYFAQEKDMELRPSPEEITLEGALALYEQNMLQQSPEPIQRHKFRDLEPWPEAALFIHA